MNKMEKLHEIICGRFEFNSLPTLKPRIIRLFLCAPYDDSLNEVDHLQKYVYPKLREFTISRYGFEFQVVDLFSGINNNNYKQSYESIQELCLNELIKCQLNSIGVNFLCLIGNLYALNYLPDWIERNKYETIIQCLNEEKEANHQDLKLIEKFYSLNINYLSNRYELINFQYINDEIKMKLNQILIYGTRLAVDKNLIDSTFLTDLDSSILEKLVTKGISESKSKLDRVFSYVRLLTNEKYDNNELKLIHLRDKQINYNCPAEQIYRIRINKIDDNYLRNFGNHYLQLFENLIEKSVQLNPEPIYSDPFGDILNHFDYMKTINFKSITAVDETITKSLRDYIFINKTTKPLILIGPSGTGKTSYMSMFASNMNFQFIVNNNLEPNNSNNYSLILRFIGIDEKSCYLRNLLKSVCLQMNLILNRQESKVPEKLSDLKRYFKNTLTQNHSMKLIVMLDSLECLSNKDNSFKLDWLPDCLNYNCKLILSLSSECGELFERFKRKYPDNNDYLIVNNLNLEQTNYVLRKHLALNNYRLEKEQFELIQNLMKKIDTILPLHLKLITDEILNWKSFTKIDKCVLKETIKESIIFLIERLEKEFGTRLTQHVLSYVTISKNGFSELELLDILSLDNELLKEFKSKDLLKHSLNVIRFPFVYLCKLLNALKNYLIIRPFNCVYTLYWKHSLFSEIIYNRYLKKDKKLLEYLHRNIAEYYLGTWSNSKLKPLSYEITVSSKSLDPDCLFDKLILQNIEIKADRLVPAQPSEYSHFHTHIKSRYNLRKLSLLPYHLFKANMIKELLNEIYFNIEWLYLKIKNFDLKQLIYDFDLYKLDHETNIICECLKMAEQAIADNPKYLFSEISGRLISFYDLYPNIKRLVDQSDKMCLKLNPLLPFGQTFQSPAWIQKENLQLKMMLNDTVYLEVLENDFNGHILMAKNHKSNLVKFVDLDLIEQMNQIDVAGGGLEGGTKSYCSKNADFICYPENNSKLVIKRIATGDYYTHGQVEFEPNEIGKIFTSTIKYAAITFRKSSSPLLIDLNLCKKVHVFPYSTNFCAFSPDDKVILIHSEKYLNYFHLNYNNVPERKFCLNSLEIPEIVLFANKNLKIFSLYKDTKQIFYYSLNLEKNVYTSDYILQDRDITDMKITNDESKLLVCSLTCIYVLVTLSNEIKLVHKLKANNLDSLIDMNNKLNVFNGFGATLDNKMVYATIYSYLICYQMETGLVLRIFQTSLSANRILKSTSSKRSDMIVSLIDDGSLILWNLANIQVDAMKFDDMRVHDDQVVDCLLPLVNNGKLALTYSNKSPDAKIHSLNQRLNVKSIITDSYNEILDNPLKTQIKACSLDATGKYCFMITCVQDFKGKQVQEKNFSKMNCALIDLTNDNRVILSFSYITKNGSRFEIQAKFIRHNMNNADDETFLFVKQTSCLNDFDPYCKQGLNWSEFETSCKFYGPIKSNLNRIELYDEFKLVGECLSQPNCITSKLMFACLMQECHKLTDSNNICIAERYEVRLNTYNLIENKMNSLPVQTTSLNELLTSEQFNYRNVLLDCRSICNGIYLLLIYSKQGANKFKTDPNSISRFEYDYEKYCFKRNIGTTKAGIIYDPNENKIIASFNSILSETTNVENILISNCGQYLLDNNSDLYDLSKNSIKLVRRLNRPDLDLNLKWANFILNGRYLILSNKSENKIFLIRCYDSVVVASFRLDQDQLSCLRVGEQDRTILLGTKNGAVLPLRLLIDLEFNEAIQKFQKFYRDINNNNQNKKILNSDVNKVKHSAYAHLLLKSREISSAKGDRSKLNTETSSSNMNEDTNYNNRINKANLMNLTLGIRHSNSATTTTRACILQ